MKRPSVSAVWLILLNAVGLLVANSSWANTVASADGNVVANVALTGGNLTYTISYRGATVVESSPLGMLVIGADLGLGVTLGTSVNYTNSVNFISRHGIHSNVLEEIRGKIISVTNTASGIGYRLNVAVFTNGVALRFEFTDGVTRAITGESTGFVIPAASTVWFQSGTSVYEGMPANSDITSLATNATLGPPANIQLPGTNGFVALTEAVLGAFPNPYLVKSSNALGRMLVVAYPTNQNGTVGATFSATITNTPWNIIMLGADLNMIVNNNMIECLSAAPDPALFPQGTATTWATTGCSVWDYLNPQPGGITYTNAMTNSYWANKLGWNYNTIDAGWADWNGGNPWPQVKTVTSFSHPLGVKIILWKTGSELSTQSQRTTFFQLLTNNGVDGLKVDFFDFNSVSAAAQERIQLQENILREAAGYHLVISFHGTSKPTGLFRTYPNLLQYEAVFGKEQFPGPFSESVPPFVRLLAGPADFTPLALQGGLLSGKTKAFEIGTVIALPGPLVTIAERSDIVAASPFAPLIKSIPNLWDETRVLSQSQIGQTTAIARRKGQSWYVALMNQGTARNWNLPLNFLDANTTYQSDIIRDNSVHLEAGTVTSTNILTVSATAGGGIIAWFYQSATNIYQPPTNTTASTNLDFEAPAYTLGVLVDTLAPSTTNAAFIGQQGWSQSTSGGQGAIVATTTSGLYTGGQALGSGNAGNAYIGANANLVLGRKYRFDLFAPSGNKAGVAGFVDSNHDGLFAQAESSPFAGVSDSGGVSLFGFRDQIAGGTIYSSGVAANTTDWYRITVTLDDATRTATMDVIDLSTGGTVVDLNGVGAGTSFSHTWPSALWVSPTNFVGVIGRASTTLLIDNIVVLQPAVDPPINLQIGPSGNAVQLTWTRGSLLQATNILGPWATNSSAVSPFVPAPDAPQMFYRVITP